MARLAESPPDEHSWRVAEHQKHSESEVLQGVLEELARATERVVRFVGDDRVLADRLQERLLDRLRGSDSRAEWPVLAALVLIGQLSDELSRRPELNEPGVAGDGSGCSFCGKALGQVRSSFEGPGVRICDDCVDFCHANPELARTTSAPWLTTEDPDER
jgi:hypothetical protein